jgi:hypothetical protein
MHMTVNWGALGVVAGVSLVVVVLIVVLVSLAMVGLSAREPDPAGGHADGTLVVESGRSRVSRTAGTASAGICLLSATAIVLYGLYILTF